MKSWINSTSLAPLFLAPVNKTYFERKANTNRGEKHSALVQLDSREPKRTITVEEKLLQKLIFDRDGCLGRQTKSKLLLILWKIVQTLIPTASRMTRQQ